MRLVLTLTAILIVIFTGRVAAAPDYGCVTSYLEGTSYAVEAKAKTAVLLARAEEFRTRLELTDTLPALSPETVGAWCAFVTSDEGNVRRVVAALELYPVSLKELPELDDGVGPMPFDFRKYALASRYDGLDCGFVIGDPLHKADGRFRIDGGHLTFHDGEWFVGGNATGEMFNRFNVAITEEGALVGKFPTYLNVTDPGEVAQEAHTVLLNGKQGQLGHEVPVGIVKLPVDVDAPVKFYVVGCVTGGQQPEEQYAFDFSGFKIDESIDNIICAVKIDSLDPDPYLVGSASIEFSKGRGKFGFGVWSTRSPDSAFNRANLAITTDRRLVGLIDVWRMYQEPGQFRPPALVVLGGKDKPLQEDLSGTLDAYTDKNASVGITLRNCRKRS